MNRKKLTGIRIACCLLAVAMTGMSLAGCGKKNPPETASGASSGAAVSDASDPGTPDETTTAGDASGEGTTAKGDSSQGGAGNKPTTTATTMMPTA